MFALLSILSNHLFDGISDVYAKLRPDHYEKYYDLTSDVGLDDKYVKYFVITNTPNFFKGKEVKTTIGRYLKLMFPSLTPAQITHLSEKYKSVVNNVGTFAIIDGQNLVDAYYTGNYYKHTGTLGSSCMRFNKCQTNNYFDIYKDHAKMLIMHPKKGKRIMGRAILWPYKDTYLMDRVYSIEGYVEHQFYEYAKKNKFYILAKNRYVAYGEEQCWLSPDDNYKDPVYVNYTIELNKKYPKFPYIDSVCYFNNDTLSTVPKYNNGYCLCAHTTYGSTFYIYE